VTALEDAARGVEEARTRLSVYLQQAGGLSTARVGANLDVLIAAVRRHDAETVRAEGHHWSGEAGQAILQTADRIGGTTP
jgi:hypothetical protein